ncbi:MAG: two-component system NtrC family response regulator, partial [Neolewinella sp.]
MPHNILIIDDDTMVSTSLELLLKRAGYGVKSVSRPAEALPAIAEHRPSLALL